MKDSLKLKEPLFASLNYFAETKELEKQKIKKDDYEIRVKPLRDDGKTIALRIFASTKDGESYFEDWERKKKREEELVRERLDELSVSPLFEMKIFSCTGVKNTGNDKRELLKKFSDKLLEGDPEKSRIHQAGLIYGSYVLAIFEKPKADKEYVFLPYRVSNKKLRYLFNLPDLDRIIREYGKIEYARDIADKTFEKVKSKEEKVDNDIEKAIKSARQKTSPEGPGGRGLTTGQLKDLENRLDDLDKNSDEIEELLDGLTRAKKTFDINFAEVQEIFSGWDEKPIEGYSRVTPKEEKHLLRPENRFENQHSRLRELQNRMVDARSTITTKLDMGMSQNSERNNKVMNILALLFGAVGSAPVFSTFAFEYITGKSSTVLLYRISTILVPVMIVIILIFLIIRWKTV